jgi:hypothetical protein
MRPIESRINEVVEQALLCVRYRIAPLRILRPISFVHAMGVRYGLLGAAAVAVTLERADPIESVYAYEWAAGFHHLVMEDIWEHTFPHFPITVRRKHIPVVASIAQEVLLDALPLPLAPHDPTEAAATAVDRHLVRHLKKIRKEWGFWRAEAGEEVFVNHALASEAFAVAFLDRQRCGLSEVPEIALLGE